MGKFGPRKRWELDDEGDWVRTKKSLKREEKWERGMEKTIKAVYGKKEWGRYLDEGRDIKEHLCAPIDKMRVLYDRVVEQVVNPYAAITFPPEDINLERIPPFDK